ncbi:MAG: hypothetical protein ACRYGK_12485 [Janthinobacterium lividum]
MTSNPALLVTMPSWRKKREANLIDDVIGIENEMEIWKRQLTTISTPSKVLAQLKSHLIQCKPPLLIDSGAN